MSSITTFKARKILTMNPARPTATHVAVRDGRILAVGTAADMRGWGPIDVDERFADKVIMPGLVEGHCHVHGGVLWQYVYVGFHDRRGPDGTLHPGLKSIDEVVARLRQAERDLTNASTPLFAWGFDPIYFGEQRMTTTHLDQVSTSRAVLVLHASIHITNVNTVVLEQAFIGPDTPVDGIVKDEHGAPTGELREPAAMFLAFDATGADFFNDTIESMRNFGRVARLAGVTTATDLLSNLTDSAVKNFHAVTAEPDFPIRLVPALNAQTLPADEGVAHLRAVREGNTDKLRFGLVKIITDGSIQGFTARLRWPGYYNGAPNGLWVTAPAQLKEYLRAYHKAGFQVHMHVNGDEATEVALNTLDQVLTETPRRDHRHTLQHCQMATEDQFRRMRTLGACVNLFANHIFYWGDAHVEQTMGPERAARMDALGSARRHGIPFAMHSDAPITPLGPLFTAWCAVNRRTASGRVLGELECLPVADALHAITLGAAYTLSLDHEIGSIECGKRADFAVLEDDPMATPPGQLKDIGIHGTVLGGRVFAANA